MKASLRALTQKLFTPVDAASLGMFRILFGALMFWQAFYYLEKGRWIKYFVKPPFHFTYEWFSFVAPWPEKILQVHLIVMVGAALMIMLGLFYRVGVFLFLVTYSYVFLLDKAYYNNHYYFIILLTFLMLFVDAHRWGSLDQWRRGQPALVPSWNLFILKAQVFIVYFFGGIAKLNSDWLSGEPMRGWLQQVVGSKPWAAPFLAGEWPPYFFSWGGALFDLSIGFLLLFRKTRLFAFAGILIFNLSNSALFSIGVFPFLMIAAATLFDEPDWPRKLFPKLGSSPAPSTLETTGSSRRGVLAFISIYFLIQILVPLRHWLYPGNVSWTEEGHLFSWHMKLRDKRGRVKVWVTDPKTNSTFEVKPREELNRLQWGKFVQRPQFIHQYVRHLKEKFVRQGLQNPIIRVDAWISLNGRPYQQAIDPNVNLADEEVQLFSQARWILPLDPTLKPGTLKGGSPEKEKEETPEPLESPL